MLAALVMGLGALSVHRKAETFQTLGFTTQTGFGAWPVLAVEAPETGLEAGDQILMVNGFEVRTGQELRDILLSGSESRLTVLRGEELETVAYTPPGLDIDFPYSILAVIGALYLLIGLFALLRGSGRPKLLFAAWCLLYSVLLVVTPGAADDTLNRVFFLADLLAMVLVPALTVHLFLVFPRDLTGHPVFRRALPFFYLPATALLLLYGDLILAGGSVLLRPASEAAMGRALGTLDTLAVLHLVTYTVLAAAILAWRVIRQSDWEERGQMQWIALGAAVGYVPYLLRYLGQQLVPGAALLHAEWLTSLVLLPLAMVPLTFAWAIFRYKLWDIDVIVRNVASYTVTGLIGVIGFSLVHSGLSYGLPAGLGVLKNLLSFSAGLMIAAMVAPAHKGISTALERLQYRGSFGQRRGLMHFAAGLLEERDLRELCRTLLTSLEEGLELERASLYLLQRDPQGAHELLLATRPEPESPLRFASDALGADLWEARVFPISPVAMPEGNPNLAQQLFMAGYRYAFPLTLREKQVGLVLASYKLGSRPLNSDDLELAQNLLGQAALAIENAGLLHELHQQLAEVGRLQRHNEGIIDSSPAGMVVLDASDGVISANPAFARVVGKERSEVVGLPIEALLPVRPLPEPGSRPTEASYCTLAGEEHHFQLSCAWLHHSERQLRILIVHDISERVAMENALREQDRLASLGMLAAGVAHEVNTPLTGISSYAQLLLADTPEGDPHHGLLKKVEQQTFRASRIVNNLLEFARDRNSEYRRVALNQVISETLDLLKERSSKRRIRVHWEPPAESVYVVGSDGELQQVLTNLILNAQDAMAEQGGELTLQLSAQGDAATIVVEDTGTGIPAERLEKIFQPFFSTKLTRGGTGLGLSISYDIVRRHGGELRVSSKLGRGTRFVVELPRQWGDGPSDGDA
jgi:PAS domain S-box-containing protein